MRSDPNDTETGPNRTSAPGEPAASAPDGRSARAASPPSERSGVHPVKALAIVAALILIATGLVWWSLPDEPADDTNITPSSNANPEPELLTEAEALSEWRDLTEDLDQAIKERDVESLHEIFTLGSPAGRRAETLLRNLVRRNVLERTDVITTSTDVLEIREGFVRVHEVRALRPCFLSEEGEDVTRSPAAIEQEIIWLLRRDEAGWRIHNSRLMNDRYLDRDPAHCTKAQMAS